METFQNSMKSPDQISAETGYWVAALLAMIAGYVDAYCFISYRTYMSFMSGNTSS